MANVGMPQNRKTGETKVYVEGKLITIGDEVNLARNFAKKDDDGKWSYSARDVVKYLKSEWMESEACDDVTREIQVTLEKESKATVSEKTSTK